MTENEFDVLWKRAEAEGYGRRLAAEYPAWRQRQRRNISIVAALLIIVGTSDAQWVALASEMLME